MVHSECADPLRVNRRPHPCKALRDSRQRDRVVFDAVSFSYPGAERPAVTGVSFTIEAGQKVALVGASGAGGS